MTLARYEENLPTIVEETNASPLNPGRRWRCQSLRADLIGQLVTRLGELHASRRSVTVR